MKSEGGVLISKETQEAVATSQALKKYNIGGGGSESERRLRELQAESDEAGTFFTTVAVPDALAMLLDCYEGNEIVQITYETTPGQSSAKVICNPGTCPITQTSTYTMERDGAPCTKTGEDDATCVPVAAELCTGSDATLSFKPSAESGLEPFYTITLIKPVVPVSTYSSGGGGGGGGGDVVLPVPPIVL
jgi:hypothetical protein